MRLLRLALVVLLASAALGACKSTQPARSGPSPTGCGKDSDCAGNAICERGACVEPVAAPSAPAK